MGFPYLETALRFLIPLSIFRYAKLGILLSIIADLNDWKFLNVTTAQELVFYQSWDKTLDLYYQSIIFIVILKFKDHLFKKTAIILFGCRLLGVALFSLTQNSKFLFFFPNIFENFVIFYLLALAISKKDIVFTSKKMVLVALAFLSIPKLIHEYFMHFLVKQPWEIYNAGKYLGFSGLWEELTNNFVFGSLLYVIPFATIIIIYKKHLSK